MSGEKQFVNSLGLKMIFVTGKAFAAWTPSMAARSKMIEEGKSPNQMFALNRPRQPISAEVEDYYLAEFPVTNKVYREFVQATGYDAPGGRLMSFCWESSCGATWELEGFEAGNLPVTGVNDQDIDAFCKWFTDKEGRNYRAATIREYEYANRAGTDTLFWWGDYADARYMNYGVSQIGHPTPVGSYAPNPWGFYDMHGNVWEYCADGDRLAAMGGAFNSPQRLTGVDTWGNFAEGPNFLRLLSTGFRLACDASEGSKRPVDLDQATIIAADAKGPDSPALEITVHERIQLGPSSTNSTIFLATRSGTWIVMNKRSTNRGKTWQECNQLGEAFCQLRDGSIVSIVGPDSGGGQSSFDHMEGKSTLEVLVSKDDWKTVEKLTAPLYVPLGRQFQAVRGLIELDDGRLLATMYGNMDGDCVREESPVAFELANPWIKTRVIVVESADKGKSWRYLSTLSYNPHLGTEGQNETDLFALPNGSLFAAMRTGIHGDRDAYGREHLDQPLLTAWSADGGRTWSSPQRVYVKGKLITGIYPRILITEEGVLAILRCRPDGSVIFSPGGDGANWSDEVVYYPGGSGRRGVPYHAGMQDMQLIGPNTILVADVVAPDGWPPTGGWRIEGVPITLKKK